MDTITGDEKLSADVKCMLAQEVNHAAAHMAFNKHLASIGYDVKAATTEIERLLEKSTVGLNPLDMLGVVAAGEHGLYSFAEVFIRIPAIRSAMHPQVKQLFLYHLLEEAGHRCGEPRSVPLLRRQQLRSPSQDGPQGAANLRHADQHGEDSVWTVGHEDHLAKPPGPSVLSVALSGSFSPYGGKPAELCGALVQAHLQP